ncbi:MAG: MFS transporter [Spirochaetales bacterium]|nr:MFS transporter [Spirochaetales bacterium]
MARLMMKRLDYAAALGMFVYASSVVATPIILLRIAEELGFGLAEGGGIEAVRAGFLLAILILSGGAAAHFGKTRSLGTGGLVLAAGLLTYSIAPSYGVVLAAIILVGLGGGILEALLNPLIQEEHPDDSGRYLNVLNAFFSIGVLTSVLVVGDLLTRGVSWRMLIAGIGVLAAASGVLFFIFGHDAAGDAPSTAPSGEGSGSSAAKEQNTVPLRRQIQIIVRDRRFWLFSIAMFCAGGAEGAFTFWSASYIQLNFGGLARAGAFGTAVFAGGMVVGRLASGHLVKQEWLHLLIVASALLGVGASLGAWAVQTMASFMAVIFFSGLTIACFWPSIQSYAASSMDVDSTMLFILLSCAGIPGFGLVSWIMGLVAEVRDLRTSLLVIPILLAALAGTMLASRIGERKLAHVSG